MEDLVLKLMTYDRLFICHLIWLKIVKWILSYLKKFLAKKLWNGICFQRKNLLVWLRNTLTHQLLDWTSYPGGITKNVKNKECINKLIDIANVCIDLGHWPSHFKISITIIIPKSNKALYNSTKSFCSIILLNTTGKLFEKMIGEWLQFLLISNNFIYTC